MVSHATAHASAVDASDTTPLPRTVQFTSRGQLPGRNVPNDTEYASSASRTGGGGGANPNKPAASEGGGEECAALGDAPAAAWCRGAA